MTFTKWLKKQADGGASRDPIVCLAVRVTHDQGWPGWGCSHSTFREYLESNVGDQLDLSLGLLDLQHVRTGLVDMPAFELAWRKWERQCS